MGMNERPKLCIALSHDHFKLVEKSHAPIHIAFCVNDCYAPYLTVPIKSIVENHRNCAVCIHVLTDRISPKNRARLSDAAAGIPCVRLEIHIVDDHALKGLKTGVWTIYTWYRLLLPEILPDDVKKVLYLDADTLVVADLRELFSLDMTGKAIAASLDSQSFDHRAFERCGYEPRKKYICAGVLLMNLDYWRKENLVRRLVDWANVHSDHIAFPDQDTINYVCRDAKIVLPFRYNILNVFLTDFSVRSDCMEELRACIDHPVIIHYAGTYPWIKAFATHLMQGEWIKYNSMLTNPVRTEWIPSKWIYMKILIWRILHPFSRKSHLTIDELRCRLRQ